MQMNLLCMFTVQVYHYSIYVYTVSIPPPNQTLPTICTVLLLHNVEENPNTISLFSGDVLCAIIVLHVEGGIGCMLTPTHTGHAEMDECTRWLAQSTCTVYCTTWHNYSSLVYHDQNKLHLCIQQQLCELMNRANMHCENATFL